MLIELCAALVGKALDNVFDYSARFKQRCLLAEQEAVDVLRVVVVAFSPVYLYSARAGIVKLIGKTV
jgi:hypothetical protein